MLIGGDPGIGKSTLLLQAVDTLSANMKALYVTGEESGAQVALRARRLGLDGSRVRVLAEIHLERILAAIEAEAPGLLRHRFIRTCDPSSSRRPPARWPRCASAQRS